MTTGQTLTNKLNSAMFYETKKNTKSIDCNYVRACTDAILFIDSTNNIDLSEKRIQKNISKIYEKSHHANSINRIRTVVLVLAAVFIFSLTCTAAVQISKSIINHNGYFSIDVDNMSGVFSETPDAPKYIPIQYSLIKEDFSDYYCLRTYSDGQNELSVDVYSSLDSIDIYMEAVDTVTLNGKEYNTFISSDGRTGVFFINKTYAYFIIGNEKIDILLSIAESIF